MVFLFINIFALIAVSCVTYRENRAGGVTKSSENLVYLSLFATLVLFMRCLTMIACFYAPHNLAIFTGKLTYMFQIWLFMSFCEYILTFPSYKRNKVLTFCKWILNIFAAYVLFLNPDGFVNIQINRLGRYFVKSGHVFSGAFGKAFPISWYDFMTLIYVFLMPFISCIMVWVRMENNSSKIDRQRMRFNVFGVLLTWLIFIGINRVYSYQSMFQSLTTVALLPMLAILYATHAQTEIFDGKSVFHGIGKFILRFLLPALVVGIVYVLLIPLQISNKTLFVVLFALFLVAFVTFILTFGKVVSKLPFMRDRRYGDSFEADITSIDFNKESSEITDEVFSIFKKYVETSSMQVLIDNGAGYLETIFSTDESKMSLPMEDEAFDTLLNIKHTIVFREWAMRNYTIAAIRKNLLKLLDDAHADAFVLLTEGRHIVGAIFLGKKTNGNIYNPYDYSVFSKLYSNFFVIVYYMKNIMNQDVVGTVNREIRMSGQIITSIQENMDKIKNPKIDAGYLMVPAHNIGGEFIDFIRLNDTRHIFIIGALSGKGIAASMNMVILKSIIRTFLAETKDFKKLVVKVNDFIRDNLPKGTLFSGTFGLLDFASNTMYYINCGSSGIFLYTRAYNNVIEIQGEGRVLGFSRDIEKLLKTKKVKLAPGDVVVSCTDGLLESVSLRGERFGKSRVQKNLVENMNYPAQKMCQFTFDALEKFTSTALENDVTLLTLKYNGGE